MRSTRICPGAVPLAGPPLGGPSVICGPLAEDQERERVVGMKGLVQGVVFTSRHDPRTYHGTCHGHYELCPIWRAERERIWAQRDKIGEDDTRPSLEPQLG